MWIAAGEELLRQQQAFIQAVCDYNRNIAEYSVAVAGPTATPQILTAMLIGPTQPAVAPVASTWADPRAVRPASAVEPVTGSPQPTFRNEPTLAPPRTKQEPTLAPPRDGWRSSDPMSAQPGDGMKTGEPTLAPPREGLQPVEKGQPTLAPPRDVPAAASSPPETSLAPVEPPSATAVPQSANKPVDASLPAQNGAAPSASLLYPALADAAPAVQAKQLSIALDSDRSLPQGSGQPLSLAECLRREGGLNRRATIDAYWLVWQRAAQRQTFVRQSEMLAALAPVVLEHRLQPAGPTEMLRLHASQTAAEAEVRQAQTALVEAQYALAARIGATADAAWPLASTVPHSGRYLMKLELQPQSLVASWPVRRLAATLPGLGENVQQAAAAVIAADAARVAAAEQYGAGAVPFEQVLEGISRQTEQTLAFLGRLTEYNREIAEYVLTVFPAAGSSDQLVTALVVNP